MQESSAPKEIMPKIDWSAITGEYPREDIEAWKDKMKSVFSLESLNKGNAIAIGSEITEKEYEDGLTLLAETCIDLAKALQIDINQFDFEVKNPRNRGKASVHRDQLTKKIELGLRENTLFGFMIAGRQATTFGPTKTGEGNFYGTTVTIAHEMYHVRQAIYAPEFFERTKEPIANENYFNNPGERAARGFELRYHSEKAKALKVKNRRRIHNDDSDFPLPLSMSYEKALEKTLRLHQQEVEGLSV